MSSAAGSTNDKKPTSQVGSPRKGKGKGPATAEEPKEYLDDEMEEDESDEDEDDEGEDEDDEDENMEDILEPEGILPRRTRGIKVDYTSKEALEKAGLKEGDASDEDE